MTLSLGLHFFIVAQGFLMSVDSHKGDADELAYPNPPDTSNDLSKLYIAYLIVNRESDSSAEDGLSSKRKTYCS